ncbi:MAG: 30S ribosomal protein S3 [Zetaproteobacteria bacterium]|nr:MAG: 30S ribosomal protein S3 [Zetaproteobacteria bacterium]
MGQKVNPIGFRVGITRGWDSRWYADKKQYKQWLLQDLQMRRFVKEKLYHAGVSRIEIERRGKSVRMTVHTSRPGVVIGKKGAEIEALRQELLRKFGVDVQINIREVRKPDLEAQLVAENVAFQLERRVAFRRAMKRAVQNALRMGAKGVRIACSGRLGGAEIARREWYLEGRVPLHTLRADIDYGFAEAKTTYGVIGVKVWIFRGEKLGDETEE